MVIYVNRHAGIMDLFRLRSEGEKRLIGIGQSDIRYRPRHAEITELGLAASRPEAGRFALRVSDTSPQARWTAFAQDAAA
jgi:hypothetical protein